MSQLRKTRRHLRGVHIGNEQKRNRNALLAQAKRDTAGRSPEGEGKYRAARVELLHSLQRNKRVDMELVRSSGYA